jgi:hypothetical protein
MKMRIPEIYRTMMFIILLFLSWGFFLYGMKAEAIFAGLQLILWALIEFMVMFVDVNKTYAELLKQMKGGEKHG